MASIWTDAPSGARASGSKVGATYFRSELENEIFTSFPPPNFIATPGNRDTRSSQEGVELFGRANFGTTWRIDAAYTYLRAREDGVEEVRRPEHTASLAVDWRTFGEDGGVTVVARYNGETSDSAFIDPSFIPVRVRLDDYLLVGVSHSCSGEWDHLPKLTSTWLDTGASAREIDTQVKTASQPLYRLDIETLERIAPDVIVSQSLCNVCAVPSGDVLEAVHSLTSSPVLVDLAPHRLADIPTCFANVGSAIGRDSEAGALQNHWDETLESYRDRHVEHDFSVAFLDWLAPPFVAGHWIPDMITLLGLRNVLGKSGEPSFETRWEDIHAAAPDLVIAACCGFDAERAGRDEIETVLPFRLLDGHRHFSRPSPALLPSLALLSDTVAEFVEHG